MGVNFYPLFLSSDSRADLNRVIDHIAHICDLGGEAHVGLGSDFDGIETHPEGLRNAGDIPAPAGGNAPAAALASRWWRPWRA